RGCVRVAAASVHAIAARRGAAHRRTAGDPRIRAGRRAAEPARRPDRVPVPHALSPGGGPLRARGAVAATGRRTARRLSSGVSGPGRNAMTAWTRPMVLALVAVVFAATAVC